MEKITLIKDYRTAIVTGASRGVGVYNAKALAQEGINLILAARNSADLDRIGNEIKGSSLRVLTAYRSFRLRRYEEAYLHR